MSEFPIFGAVIGIGVVVGGMTLALGSWYTVDQGERGVILRNGALVGTAEPGLGFKTPLIERVIDISVQSQVRQYPQLAAYSKDQQPASMIVSVRYRIPADQVGKVYAEYGSAEGLAARLLDPIVNRDVKTVFGQYVAVTAIQERAQLNADVERVVRDAVAGPILIEGVQIENIDFSDAYEQSIEQRMLAQVEVEKLRQNAEREKVQADIAVTQARAQADSVRARAVGAADATKLAAQADAEATRLRGEAEADAIKARGAALGSNPNLVELVKAERWNGILPTTVLPDTAVPLLTKP